MLRFWLLEHTTATRSGADGMAGTALRCPRLPLSLSPFPAAAPQNGGGSAAGGDGTRQQRLSAANRGSERGRRSGGERSGRREGRERGEPGEGGRSVK